MIVLLIPIVDHHVAWCTGLKECIWIYKKTTHTKRKYATINHFRYPAAILEKHL